MNLAISSAGTKPSPMFIAFAAGWILLNVIIGLFLHYNRNSALKRRLWPTFSLIPALMIGGYIYVQGGFQAFGLPFLCILITAMILITAAYLRSTRFCDTCGKTLYRQPVFARVSCCPHCQGPLK